jgi:hypothetical protein
MKLETDLWNFSSALKTCPFAGSLASKEIDSTQVENMG